MDTDTKEREMTEHLKFTETTWKDLLPTGLTRETAPRFWMDLHDLAVEAHEKTHEFCPISFPEMRALVDATASGLPITLTWATGDSETTATCIVTQIISLSEHTTANLYLRSWGFAHPIALGNLKAVSVPETTYDLPDPHAGEGEYVVDGNFAS